MEILIDYVDEKELVPLIKSYVSNKKYDLLLSELQRSLLFKIGYEKSEFEYYLRLERGNFHLLVSDSFFDFINQT